MITEYLRAPPYKFITLIVQTQMVLTVAFAGLIAAMLVRRNRAAAKNARRHEIYSERLVEELLDTANPAPALARPKWWQVGARGVLKSVLLEHIRIVNGSERAYLVQRYADFGFERADLRGLDSVFWWRRLQSASNLSSLESERFAVQFSKLTEDRHKLVSAFGYYALSSLDHSLNYPVPVERLPPTMRSRRNLLVEILHNWARIYSSRAITDQIAYTYDPVLLEALIAAAAALPTPEVAASFGELLGLERVFAPELIERMLVLLRGVGDPSWTKNCVRYVSHPNEVVRLRALEYLVEMGEDQVLRSGTVARDASPLVRRALHAWRAERRAA